MLYKMFVGRMESDTVTPQEIFVTFGRARRDEHDNRTWLSAKTKPLRYYGLIAPNPSREKVVSLQLTAKGRAVLDQRSKKAQPPAVAPSPSEAALLSGISIDFAGVILRQPEPDNPFFEITFKIALKHNAVSADEAEDTDEAV